MSLLRIVPIALFAVTTNAAAAEHTAASPAAHLELKNESDTVVCFAYDTDPGTAPTASGCPEGTFKEQLFDESWSQIGERTVEVGGSMPVATRSPARVERTCEWSEVDFRETFRGSSQGDNSYAFCDITCPAGIAIDGEASASIPQVDGTDGAILERLSFTRGTGTGTIRIFVQSDIALDVAFGRYNNNGDDFTNLTYVIEAAAVCL